MEATSPLRAWRRLLVLAALTAHAILRLKRARKESGNCPHEATRH